MWSGDRDVHRVDVLVLLLEQLAPVLVDAHLGEALLQPLEPREIDIGDGDEIERGCLANDIRSLSAWPDAPMLAWRSIGAAARAERTGTARRRRRRRRSGETFCGKRYEA